MALTKQSKILTVVLIFVATMGIAAMLNSNSLVAQKATKDKAWADVETQYQRRQDLITNIVGSVKGAQKNEEKFVEIAKARSGTDIDKNASTDEKAKEASKNESTIVSIVPKLQEAYPELKSDAHITELINQLNTTEDKISIARSHYNDVVTKYNVYISSLPQSIFASLFHYKTAELYKADSSAKSTPKVDFNE